MGECVTFYFKGFVFNIYLFIYLFLVCNTVTSKYLNSYQTGPSDKLPIQSFPHIQNSVHVCL